MFFRTSRGLTLRYALVQGLYWAAFAAVIAFASVFLLASGFSNTQIGVLLAVANILAAITQPLLAAQVDKHPALTARYTALLLVAGAFAASLLLYWLQGIFWLTACLYCLAAMLIQSVHGFINAMGFELNTQTASINFGVARGCGALAYGVVAWQLGSLVTHWGAGVILLILSALWVACYFYRLPAAASHHTAGDQPQAAALGLLAFARKHRRFMLFLLGIIFIFTCYNIALTYLVQIIMGLGGTSADYGNAVLVSALFEFPTMFLFSRIVKRVPCGTLLKISGVFYLVKVLCFLLANGMGMIYVGQVMQFASFALFMPASVYYVDHLLPSADKVKGHAFTTAAITAGGVAGTLAGGWLLDAYGPTLMLAVAAVISAVGMVLFFVAVRNPEDARAGPQS